RSDLEIRLRIREGAPLMTHEDERGLCAHVIVGIAIRVAEPAARLTHFAVAESDSGVGIRNPSAEGFRVSGNLEMNAAKDRAAVPVERILSSAELPVDSAWCKVASLHRRRR